MSFYQAAAWDDLSDLPDYLLPGGGGLLAVLVAVAFLASEKNKGSGGKNKQLNDAIERAVVGVVRGVGRYVSGRDLVGGPRSTATWWRSGVLLKSDEALLTDLTAVPEPRPAPGAPAWAPPTKEAPRPPGAGVPAPLRAVWNVVASVGRALGAWSRWPHAARALTRLAPFLIAWGLWRDQERTMWVLAVAGVELLLVAVTGPGGLKWWKVRVPGADETLAPGCWAVLRQLLRLDETEQREKWLRMDRDLSAPDARIVLRLPPTWIADKESMDALIRAVDTRVPGEWVARWERTGPGQYLEWTPKPKPQKNPVPPEFVE